MTAFLYKAIEDDGFAHIRRLDLSKDDAVAVCGKAIHVGQPTRNGEICFKCLSQAGTVNSEVTHGPR